MASYNTGTTGNAAAISHTTAFTFTVPAGVATNDVMLVSIMMFTYSGATAVLNTPTSGGGSWTQIGSTLSCNQGTFVCVGAMYYRVATASDNSSTFSIGYGGATPSTDALYWAGDLESYTGFYTASPIGAVATISGVNSSTFNAPTTTTQRASSWGVYSAQVAITSSGNITSEPPTSRHVDNSGDGINTAVSDGNGSAGAAGSSIGGGSWGMNNTTGGGGMGFTVELATVAPLVAASGIHQAVRSRFPQGPYVLGKPGLNYIT